MKEFIIRRLLLLIPIIIGVSIISFLMMRLLPGDPARIIAGEGATLEDIESIRVRYALDRPLTEQYLKFMTGLFTGDLRSIKSDQPVMIEVLPRFWNTIKLSVMAMVVAVLIGLPLGIVSALKRNSWIDNLAMGISLVGISMPVFWLGILLILLFSVYLKILPPGGTGTIKHIILPAFTLGFSVSAIISRLTRASVLEVLTQDYIRTAKAFGIPKRKMIYRYVLKNALIPIITVIGLQFGYLLGGAVLTESVFGWPGLGRYIVDSIFSRDYVVVQVGIMTAAVTFVLINLVVDVLYVLINPRLRRG